MAARLFKVGALVCGVPPNLDYWWPAQVADISHAPEEHRAELSSQLSELQDAVLLRYLGSPTFEYAVCEDAGIELLLDESDLALLFVPTTGKNRKPVLQAIEEMRQLLRHRAQQNYSLMQQGAKPTGLDLMDQSTWPEDLRSRALLPAPCALTADECSRTSALSALGALLATSRGGRPSSQETAWGRLIYHRNAARGKEFLQRVRAAGDGVADTQAVHCRVAGIPAVSVLQQPQTASQADAAALQPAAEAINVEARSDKRRRVSRGAEVESGQRRPAAPRGRLGSTAGVAGGGQRPDRQLDVVTSQQLADEDFEPVMAEQQQQQQQQQHLSHTQEVSCAKLQQNEQQHEHLQSQQQEHRRVEDGGGRCNSASEDGNYSDVAISQSQRLLPCGHAGGGRGHDDADNDDDDGGNDDDVDDDDDNDVAEGDGEDDDDDDVVLTRIVHQSWSRPRKQASTTVSQNNGRERAEDVGPDGNKPLTTIGSNPNQGSRGPVGPNLLDAEGQVAERIRSPAAGAQCPVHLKLTSPVPRAPSPALAPPAVGNIYAYGGAEGKAELQAGQRKHIGAGASTVVMEVGADAHKGLDVPKNLEPAGDVNLIGGIEQGVGSSSIVGRDAVAAAQTGEASKGQAAEVRTPQAEGKGAGDASVLQESGSKLGSLGSLGPGMSDTAHRSWRRQLIRSLRPVPLAIATTSGTRTTAPTAGLGASHGAVTAVRSSAERDTLPHEGSSAAVGVPPRQPVAVATVEAAPDHTGGAKSANDSLQQKAVCPESPQDGAAATASTDDLPSATSGGAGGGLHWRAVSELPPVVDGFRGLDVPSADVAAGPLRLLRSLARDPVTVMRCDCTTRRDAVHRGVLLLCRELCFANSRLAKTGFLGRQTEKLLKLTEAWQGVEEKEGEQQQDASLTRKEQPALQEQPKRTRRRLNKTNFGAEGDSDDDNRVDALVTLKRRCITASGRSKDRANSPTMARAVPAALAARATSPAAGGDSKATTQRETGARPSSPAFGGGGSGATALKGTTSGASLHHLTKRGPLQGIDDMDFDLGVFERPLQRIVDVSSRRAGSCGPGGVGSPTGAPAPREATAATQRRPNVGSSTVGGRHLSSLVNLKPAMAFSKPLNSGTSAATPLASTRLPVAAGARPSAGVAERQPSLGAPRQQAPPPVQRPQPLLQKPAAAAGAAGAAGGAAAGQDQASGSGRGNGNGDRVLIWFGKGVPMPTERTVDEMLEFVVMDDPCRRPTVHIDYSHTKRYASFLFPRAQDATRLEALLRCNGCRLLKIPSMQHVAVQITTGDAPLRPVWAQPLTEPQAESTKPATAPPPVGDWLRVPMGTRLTAAAREGLARAATVSAKLPPKPGAPIALCVTTKASNVDHAAARHGEAPSGPTGPVPPPPPPPLPVPLTTTGPSQLLQSTVQDSSAAGKDASALSSSNQPPAAMPTMVYFPLYEVPGEAKDNDVEFTPPWLAGGLYSPSRAQQDDAEPRLYSPVRVQEQNKEEVMDEQRHLPPTQLPLPIIFKPPDDRAEQKQQLQVQQDDHLGADPVHIRRYDAAGAASIAAGSSRVDGAKPPAQMVQVGPGKQPDSADLQVEGGQGVKPCLALIQQLNGSDPVAGGQHDQGRTELRRSSGGGGGGSGEVNTGASASAARNPHEPGSKRGRDRVRDQDSGRHRVRHQLLDHSKERDRDRERHRGRDRGLSKECNRYGDGHQDGGPSRREQRPDRSRNANRKRAPYPWRKSSQVDDRRAPPLGDEPTRIEGRGSSGSGSADARGRHVSAGSRSLTQSTSRSRSQSPIGRRHHVIRGAGEEIFDRKEVAFEHFKKPPQPSPWLPRDCGTDLLQVPLAMHDLGERADSWHHRESKKRRDIERGSGKALERELDRQPDRAFQDTDNGRGSPAKRPEEDRSRHPAPDNCSRAPAMHGDAERREAGTNGAGAASGYGRYSTVETISTGCDPTGSGAGPSLIAGAPNVHQSSSSGEPDSAAATTRVATTVAAVAGPGGGLLPSASVSSSALHKKGPVGGAGAVSSVPLRKGPESLMQPHPLAGEAYISLPMSVQLAQQEGVFPKEEENVLATAGVLVGVPGAPGGNSNGNRRPLVATEGVSTLAIVRVEHILFDQLHDHQVQGEQHQQQNQQVRCGLKMPDHIIGSGQGGQLPVPSLRQGQQGQPQKEEEQQEKEDDEDVGKDEEHVALPCNTAWSWLPGSPEGRPLGEVAQDMTAEATTEQEEMQRCSDAAAAMENPPLNAPPPVAATAAGDAPEDEGVEVAPDGAALGLASAEVPLETAVGKHSISTLAELLYRLEPSQMEALGKALSERMQDDFNEPAVDQ